jgi:hypothetical protein
MVMERFELQISGLNTKKNNLSTKCKLTNLENRSSLSHQLNQVVFTEISQNLDFRSVLVESIIAIFILQLANAVSALEKIQIRPRSYVLGIRSMPVSIPSLVLFLYL